MTLEQKAASLDREAIVALLVQVEELKRQVEWFQKQLFGRKSEKRLVEADPRQLSLGEVFGVGDSNSPDPVITVEEHTRKRNRRDVDDEADSGFRFNATVPVEEIRLDNPDAGSEGAHVVSEKVTYKLAQRPASYVVLKYVRPVIKRKDGSLSCPPAPASVLGKSVADVSLLAGLVIDKLVYHLPLYRQHQRMKAAGIRLARSTLTEAVHRAADLLHPIYEAQRRSILESSVIAMDETPIRAGRKARGGMKTGFFWPIYGDRQEVVFPFMPTRSHGVVRELLGSYQGVLLTDGYAAYERHAAQVEQVTAAQCWSHTRRQFLKAEDVEPKLTARALELIGRLYDHEAKFRRESLDGSKLVERRSELCRPVVEEFFGWLEKELESRLLLPTNPFTKAAHYALSRRKELKVFLWHPGVPLDTNHLERQIRPIADLRSYYTPYLSGWKQRRLGIRCSTTRALSTSQRVFDIVAA